MIKERNSPIFALPVHLGVEIAIIKYHCIGARQARKKLVSEITAMVQLRVLYSDTTRSRRRYEAKYTRVCIEAFCDVLPILDLGSPIQTEIQVPMEIQENLQNVQYSRHLCEYQHAVAPSFLFTAQLCQLLELSAVILKEQGIWEGYLKFDSRSV